MLLYLQPGFDNKQMNEFNNKLSIHKCGFTEKD